MKAFKIQTSDHLPLERSAMKRMQDDTLSNPEPLSHYRDVPAWVLIADPGAGKTDAFKTLSEAEAGYYTTARDFVELGSPKDQSPLIFIDGLDEMTAGNATGSTPLGQIRSKLQQLGTPKFRISCREADWRGNTDSAALQRLVGDNNFLELHLAPLTRNQTQALIAHWQPSNEQDAAQFMREAEHRDLEGLLDNPQTLRMLVKAMSARSNHWPASKTETYALACEQLVQEQNEEHRTTQQNDLLPSEQMLQAAGYLSAVMLLSGSAAIARQSAREPHAGTLALTDLSRGENAPDIAACQAALRTSLFRGTGRSEFVPVHRTVAEYLGAHYLITRIHAGLPASRVLALMLGQDAGIVPELRGLHAWLAATASEELRRELIERDPLGVVLNGDVRAFSRTEKLQVLDALRDEATRYTYFRNQNWASHSFGALATADMAGDFKALLQSADRNSPHLALLDCVLDALAHGQHMPTLAPELEQVVRDKTYWSGSRKEALEILATYAQEDNSWSTLTQLLADVHSNVVEDLEDELLGTLLQVLYPNHISPAEVWRYFRKPKSEQLLGSYWQFWHDLSKEKTPPEDVPILLDALFSTGYQLSNQHDHMGSPQIVGELLVRGVTQNGDRIDVRRLYNWLSLGLGPHQHCPLDQPNKAALAQWLGERPAIYKALFEHGLSVQANTSETVFRNLWWIRAKLYGAPEPDDAMLWYLSLAEASIDENLRRQLVTESFQLTHQRTGPNTAIELLENWSADHSIDAVWVADFLRCPYPPLEPEQEYIDHEIKYKERAAEESRQTIKFFSETLSGFATGPAHLGALVEVANAYLNFFRRSDEKNPETRLLELLNQDKEWVRLALHGLRQCLFRDNLPSAADIVDLHTKGRRYSLAAPCLAAMELRYAEDPAAAFDLPPALLETVVAFRLTNNFYETPVWFKQLLTQRPTVLANVLQRLISQQIGAKREHVDGLQVLALDADYAAVASQISPKLIADFPVKASKKQLPSLRLLIVSMMGRVSRETQLSLIASKLSTKGMDVAQHAYWLTAGVLLAPELYLERTQQFVEKTQVRISHVFALVHERRGRGRLQADLPVATQSFLIGLLGSRSNPSWVRGSGWVTPEMEMGRYVESLISALAGKPDDAALDALTALQQRQDLKHWGDSLSRALYDQRITRRKALFKPASVAKVCQTLANKLNPANAADLFALTVDHLKQLIRGIRDSDTDDYDQYWAGDIPKSEERCRNALLSALKPRLAPISISAEPERHHADRKRADIEVASGLIHIPMEAKGEWHKDVWKAIGNQLIAQYCREPASDGYGIFLVFWFAGNMKAAPTDGGAKVKTPQELQQRLAATVPEELRHKIAVLVVDCSKPTATQSIKKISL
ncbi:NACHT domain-containing protein [Rhodoferax ferrireducens]|uniref:NACHT domain-containing protein n=1 Tax=Rhodoferax ferrireducens TaxID=192843 RepID=UPI003BB6462F